MSRTIAAFICALMLWIAAHSNFALAQNNTTQTAEKSTLRVGFWTLWHDRTVTLTPAGTNARIAKCASCDGENFSGAIKISADQEEILIEGGGAANSSATQSKRDTTLFVSGAIELSAHGEKETPRVPIQITARKGQLVMSATLPVEFYVERVVASESSGADSAESLKALAIIVRSFALHQKHVHLDYDLCDSTHCQLLHWHGNPTRAAAAHAATLATAGETLWFHGRVRRRGSIRIAEERRRGRRRFGQRPRMRRATRI